MLMIVLIVLAGPFLPIDAQVHTPGPTAQTAPTASSPAESVAPMRDVQPRLSETQRLSLENKVLRYQVAQLQAENSALRNQLAVSANKQAEADVLQFLQSLQIPGYTFDPSTMVYTKSEAKK
jgi:hypothetical protein